MQIGCSAPTSGPLIAPDSLVRIATEAEMLGFDYITVSDHVMMPKSVVSRYPYSASGEFPSGAGAARLEQLTTAAFIAAATSKLRIVTSVMVVPHRPAVLTAKILATIDYLSKGRLTLGIGAGWCKEEFEAIGAPPFEDRGNVTDEWMMACKELWAKDDPKFDGKYVKFSDVVFTPKPVQKSIPIWVGGESGPALRRTAKYADAWYPIGTNPQFPMDTLTRFKAGVAKLRDLTAKAGRDPVRGDGWPIAFRPTRRRSRRARWTASASCSPAAPRISSATSRRWPRRASRRSISACSRRPWPEPSTTCGGSRTR